MPETKEINWLKWNPTGKLMPNFEETQIHFCSPCDHLKQNQYGEPVCREPGSTKMRECHLVFQLERYPYASVNGQEGVMTRDNFQPKPPNTGGRLRKNPNLFSIDALVVGSQLYLFST